MSIKTIREEFIKKWDAGFNPEFLFDKLIDDVIKIAEEMKRDAKNVREFMNKSNYNQALSDIISKLKEKDV